jgi:hypothetical protein
MGQLDERAEQTQRGESGDLAEDECPPAEVGRPRSVTGGPATRSADMQGEAYVSRTMS